MKIAVLAGNLHEYNTFLDTIKARRPVDGLVFIIDDLELMGAKFDYYTMIGTCALRADTKKIIAELDKLNVPLLEAGLIAFEYGKLTTKAAT